MAANRRETEEQYFGVVILLVFLFIGIGLIISLPQLQIQPEAIGAAAVEPPSYAVYTIGPVVYWTFNTSEWSYVTDTATGDLDQDGVADVAAIDSAIPDTIWAISDEGEELWSDTEYSGYRIAVGDISGDGVPEVIAGVIEPGIVIYYNNGTFNSGYETLCDVTDIELGDLDDSGVDDIAYSDNCVTTVNAMNPFEEWGWTDWGIPAIDLALGDLNDDGITDIASINFEFSVYTFNGSDGNHIWNLTWGDNWPISGEAIEVGDIDADNDNEVIAAGEWELDEGNLCLNNATCEEYCGYDEECCYDYYPKCTVPGECYYNETYCEEFESNVSCESWDPVCNWTAYCVSTGYCASFGGQSSCEAAECIWDGMNCTDPVTCAILGELSCSAPYCAWIGDCNYTTYCDGLNSTDCWDEYPACLWNTTGPCTENIPCLEECWEDWECCDSNSPICNWTHGLGIYAIEDDGEFKWFYPTDDLPLSIELGELDGTPGDEIVVITGEAFTVYVLDGDGTLLWSKAHGGIWPPYMDIFREIDLLGIADINNDGENEVIVGADDGIVYAYTNTGTLLWSFDTTSSPSWPIMDIETDDITGDGVDDVVAAAGNTIWVLTMEQPPEEEEPEKPKKKKRRSTAAPKVYDWTEPEQDFILDYSSYVRWQFDGVFHQLALAALWDTQGKFRIFSLPIDVTINLGETVSVDVDEDGKNDMSITLNSIVNGRADITLNDLRVAAPPALPPPAAPVCGDAVCDEGETQETCCVDCGCPEDQQCIDDVCQYVPVCGNGICETGETTENCLEDCPRAVFFLQPWFILLMIIILLFVAAGILAVEIKKRPAAPPAELPEEKLRNYIRSHLEKGISSKKIKEKLYEVGWPKRMVRDALEDVIGEQPPLPPE